MEVTAKLRNLRISPRKVRLVADLIRGMDVKAAQVHLSFLTKKSAAPMLKLLNSAIANAKHNFKLSPDNLYIAKITVDGGPVLKRVRPRAMGRAFLIRKRSSHINLTLAEKKDKKHLGLSKKKKLRNKVFKAKKKEEIKKEKAEKKDASKERKLNSSVSGSNKAEKEVKPKKDKAEKKKAKRLTGLAKRAFKKH